MLRRQTPVLLILLVSTAIVACSGVGDVPVGLRVDTGLEPQHIDEQVRFRTTYYFRVLEGCPLEQNDRDEISRQRPFVKRITGNFMPLSDSLYRFRMTGQAAALFNKIHFESGVLRKEQIDPFGSTVQFNQKTSSFLPLSADQLRAQAKSDAAMNDIARMRKLLADFKEDPNLSDESKQGLETQLKEIIQHRIDIIKTNPLASGTTGNTPETGPPPVARPETHASSIDAQPTTTNQTPSPSPSPLSGKGTSHSHSSTDMSGIVAPKNQPSKVDRRCNGQPSLKKYFLLGPEGSKELDPSDRLLMALSVDSKPLLGMLQQISEHKFQSWETSLQTMEDLLDERGRIFDAHRALLKANDNFSSGRESSGEVSLSLLSENLSKIFSTTSPPDR